VKGENLVCASPARRYMAESPCFNCAILMGEEVLDVPRQQRALVELLRPLRSSSLIVHPHHCRGTCVQCAPRHSVRIQMSTSIAVGTSFAGEHMNCILCKRVLSCNGENDGCPSTEPIRRIWSFCGGESVKLCNEFSIGAGVKTSGRIAR
jgi:hypothetical protein